MLFKNILLFVGMALAIPVEKTVIVTTTVSLVPLETPEVPKQTAEIVEEAPTPNEEEVDTSKFDTVVIVDGSEKVEVLTAEVDLSPVLEKEPEETPVIPENEELEVDTSVCSKDLLLMGNKIDDEKACKKIYDACTQKELISIIVSYYNNPSPVSIEYTINDGVNKGAITENCGNVLVNSKIFHEDTTIIEPVAEIPPVEKVTDLNQDIPTEDTLHEVKEEAIQESKPVIRDTFAKDGEDEIEENKKEIK
jgi:hypothetical protein